MRHLLLSVLAIQLQCFNVLGVFNECQTQEESCSECISSNPDCAWCEDPIYKIPDIKSYYKRCDTVQNHEDQKCQNITNPTSSFDKTKDAKLEGETRVSPQSIKIKLRPGQPKTVPIRVKTPINFPIDVYYLMDLSDTMKDDLKQVREFGPKLGDELKEITRNFRLGFGGFVDKAVGPYTEFNEIVIEDFIKEGKQMTFSYKNMLSLNESSKAFSDTVSQVQISFNVDTPEGSLEALSQVIACQSAIKWRSKKKARRIVIVTTDGLFHQMGDGLLGGYAIPYDGKCHMRNNQYDAWRKFDYPSLSEIRSMLISNDIVPIFAATGNEELYKKVSEFIGNGAQAEQMKNDSSNIAPLVRNAYEKIARTVNINADLPENIKVKFSAVCGKQGKVDGPQCNDIEIGEEVRFDVELEAKSCDADQTIDFTINTSFDDVNVTLELICECDCGDPIVNADVCTSRGNLTCGKCVCDLEKYGGRFCDCTAEEAKDQSLCKVPGTSVVCSGKGKCNCGECNCNKEVRTDGIIEYFYGDQCQCSNASCATYNNLICGGPDRGICDCGTCVCNPRWTGRVCEKECDVSEENCYDPNDPTQTKCYGKGDCRCNQCQCFKGAVGKYCDECVDDTCPDECRDFKECVKCRIFETGDLTPEQCTAECNKWNITSHIVKDKIEDDTRCLERDEDDCAFIFTYKKDNITNEITLFVQKDRICPAEPDILAIILGVIAGIVGIGLALLLIWKLLATIQDRREFAKFEKDLQNPKWDSGENPIYKKATSTFQNPMYGEKANEAEQSESPLIE